MPPGILLVILTGATEKTRASNTGGLAAAQGRIAAYNMSGQSVKYQDVPVFLDNAGLSFRCATLDMPRSGTK